jgi:hypothetical protein
MFVLFLPKVNVQTDAYSALVEAALPVTQHLSSILTCIAVFFYLHTGLFRKQ